MCVSTPFPASQNHFFVFFGVAVVQGVNFHDLHPVSLFEMVCFWRRMNRYRVTKQLGDGTYGSVLKAVNRSTGETVRHFPVFLVLFCGSRGA